MWILIVPAIAGLALVMSNKPDPADNLTLHDASVQIAESGQRYVTGVLRNNTDEPFSRVQVDIDMHAADGTLLLTASPTATEFSARSSWTFEAPVPIESAARFRITGLSCLRNGEAAPRLCALGDTVEVPGPPVETSADGSP